MSPGSQMRALTAKSARAKSSTMAAGRRVVRRNDIEKRPGMLAILGGGRAA